MLLTKSKLLAPSLLLAVVAGSLAEAVLAGDAAAARAQAQALCQNCHGENGIAVLPGAANLSGQQKEYLRTQLRAYRSGSRRDEQMNVVAKTLTDADIENLAEWYSSIKITVETPK
ncbi:MAG: c-type cytochrome [Burkholderiales bacterium]|nr:c-type cytochrome [Burkholderiales bacterium]